ncbi:MAG: outer membrane protein assembly factor BamE [Luteimonas sp.]
MPPPRVLKPRLSKYILPVLLAFGVAGCGLLYKQPIYQGNLIEKSAADQLQAGMDRQQVMTLLGTPSIADPFHQQRWDYTATQRTGRRNRTEVKTLTLWFENDALARWEGEYFPEQDQALAAQMRKFGNLPRDKKKGNRGR